MSAWLEFNGERVALGDSCAIGRLPENNIVLDDIAISRRHALIHTHGRGGLWLVDFGSSNGVRLNGRKIFEPARLRDRDRIEIAKHRMIFRERGDASSKRGGSDATAAWKTTERLSETFTPTQHAAIMLDTAGHITAITSQAQEWLKTYFELATRPERLPQKLDAWVRQQSEARERHGSAARASETLIVPREKNRLVAQLAERAGDQQLLLLTEEKPAFSVELLQTLGLTPKESEVLHWLAEGKTNPEIGIILDASPRTVGKHIEHIYEKLGVATRTAALLYVVEKLGRGAA